jgi:predicted aspartyl protease
MKIKLPVRLINIEGDGYHLAVKVRINGKSAHAILDTGASKTVFDKERIALFLKKEMILDNERLSTGLGTASMQSQLVLLKKLALGKLVLDNFPAIVLDLGHVNMAYHALGLQLVDGVIGSDVLQAYKAIINYEKKTLTLSVPAKKKKTRRK